MTDLSPSSVHEATDTRSDSVGPTAADTAGRLRHEGRLLPNVSLNPRGRWGAACRSRFDVRSLREAAEYVWECGCGSGRVVDDVESLLVTHTGTIGAKQALLAALAAEAGRDDVQLVVGCCEMPLPVSAGGREPRLRTLGSLPLAVCWLKHRGRRLQIVAPRTGSVRTFTPVTEVVVSPECLPAERVRLYKTFAADWCRALEANPIEFARLRAWQLRAAPDSSLFEDLMGYSLPADFTPVL